MRLYADEPSDNAKYTDARLVNDFLQPAYSRVFNQIALSADDVIVLRHVVTLVDGQETYLLPPNVRRILQLVRLNDEKFVIEDFKPRNERSWWGPGWVIEGNEIRFRPLPREAETWYLFYIPNGDFFIHEGYGEVGSDDYTFILDATPTLGQLDKRNQAYAGGFLRILDDGGAVVQERVIESYDPTTREVTVRTAFDPSLNEPSAGVHYEIAPQSFEPLQDAWTLCALMKLLAIKNASGAHLEAIRREYASALKTVRDTHSFLNARTGKVFEQDTRDNRDLMQNQLWRFTR
jgi:hypothetical protein